ncbi:GntR family transcriptional regulator [Gordonibacter pamelaeae]|uniref:Predicted transcriptional regulators n=1 Tax=Gordonibacter pamelaeae 7-10-1-b TaxID=657308 RepID=D6E933_9ACTN|nr:GntR family transcriptional regulator [Gordonibacter pamelaeae]CBL04230.1 Predicted transcriptional regulators [Gordonibacter pamelaeae 7-10-1-b]HJH72951.1 GntR family transcriptional regulator [Eggerthellaceae bacterium]
MTDTIIDKDVAMDAMGQFQVDDNSDIPIWIQIRKRLVYLIRSGKLDENERLPSVRELSVQLGVNYNTINKVYQDLERDGFIFTRRGKGSYVAERTAYEALDIDDEVEALATDLVGRAFEKGMEADDLVDLVREKIVQLTGRAR